MLKRVLMTCLVLGVGLVTTGDRDAQADDNQWIFIEPPGMWWTWGSLDGCASIARVPSTESHPALLRCDLNLTRIETLCSNPKGNQVAGVASTQVVVFDTIGPEDLLEKQKGKANVCVGIDEAASLGPDILCVNGNWNVVAALTTEFTATCTTEKCTGVDNPDTPENEACATTVVANKQMCACTLPAGYDVFNLPTACPDPLHPTAECTAYQCEQIDVTTGLPTGQKCELAQ